MKQNETNKQSGLRKANKLSKLVFSGTMVLIIALVIALFSTSCEKLPDTPEGELITQSFGLYTSSNIPDKSWDFNLWNWNYNTTPATLTLTGTGTSTGQNYTLETTIQALQNGTASITMLRGTYDISFITPHIQSINPWHLNGVTGETLQTRPQLGEEIDIKIEQSVNVQGTPILLQSTVNDLLIIVDLPDVTEVNLSNTAGFISVVTRLLKSSDESYHWGYFAMNSYERGLELNTDGLHLRFNIPNWGSKVIDASQWELGKVYHIQSNLGAILELDIPDMEVINVIVE